jgi:hypothetical protein
MHVRTRDDFCHGRCFLFLLSFRGRPVMASAYAPARDDLRQPAFARLRLLEQVYGDDIPWSAIAHGFACNGEKVRGFTASCGSPPNQGQRGVRLTHAGNFWTGDVGRSGVSKPT